MLNILTGLYDESVIASAKQEPFENIALHCYSIALKWAELLGSKELSVCRIMEYKFAMSDIEKPNRMIRRRQRTRDQLMAAAIELVLDKGYDTVTNEDITETADVGRRTFYNHFDNKHDCVLAAVSQRYSQYATAAATSDERHNDPALTLTLSASQVFNQVVADPVTRQLVNYPQVLFEAVNESQKEYVLQDIVSGLSKGRFNPPSSIDIIGAVLSWGFVGLIIESVRESNLEQRGAAWARIMLHNLGVNQEEINALVEKTQSPH